MNQHFCIAAIALCLNSVCALAGQPSGANANLATPSLTFNRDNAIFGVKKGQLYAYVDLASSAPMLQKLNSESLTKLVLDASSKAASEWWKSPRFSKLHSGVIDVITILNKDEYAKADFSSALMHGKVYLRHGKAGATVERHTLNFENLRNANLK
jgi:hypothetical protein